MEPLSFVYLECSNRRILNFNRVNDCEVEVENWIQPSSTSWQLPVSCKLTSIHSTRHKSRYWRSQQPLYAHPRSVLRQNGILWRKDCLFLTFQNLLTQWLTIINMVDYPLYRKPNWTNFEIQAIWLNALSRLCKKRWNFVNKW